MSDRTLGYIILKVPVLQLTDGGTLEEAPYDYVGLGASELVLHNLDDGALGWITNEVDSGDLYAEAIELPAELLEEARAAYDRINEGRSQADLDGPFSQLFKN